MKICIMGKTINVVSGHSKLVFELARELAARGNNVIILRGSSPFDVSDIPDQHRDGEGFEMVTFSNSMLMNLCLRKGKNFDIIKSTLKDIDILHQFDYIPPRLIRSCAGTSFPIIYTLNKPYRVKMSELAKSGPASFLNIVKPVFFTTLMTPDFVFRKVLDSFDKIISTSRYMAEDIVSLGIATEKVEIIPLWINTQTVKDTATNEKSSHVFLYFGWGSSIRGVPDVVKAFKLVLEKDPKATLILCFTGFFGIEEKMHKRLILKNSPVNSIVLKGYEQNISRIIESADTVVLPFRSTCYYAQPPLVVLEAMALGKCVISTFTGSIPEIISDGETGFLVQPRDYRALAQKMLVTYDETLRGKIGNQAREYIIKRHNLSYVTDRILEVYRSTIEGFYG